ncbi:MAG: ABC transporter ATP-binding protein [Mesorhizobium amorphae]|nr:MAG: ABC transporter ATP-binding protein [Mesorhizobium amorphae]
MLSVANLSFAYGNGPPLFSELSFTVEAGEALAVVGRNGAGKSTLLRLLNGLLTPQAGDVQVGGRTILDRKVDAIASQVGTLFQTPEQQLFAATVHEEVAFGPRQLGLVPQVVEERVSAALAHCALAGEESRHPLDLDHAARRFVALASVLALQPALLLLDEPQRGLDRRWTERLEAIIATERARGTAVVLICHDMDFVLRNAQTVIALGVEQPRRMAVTKLFRSKPLIAAASLAVPARIAVAERHAALQAEAAR